MSNSASSEHYSQKYYWQADYSNGRVVNQKEINFKDLDRNGIIRFSMVDPKSDKFLLSVEIEPGTKLAYRSRTIMQEGCDVVDRIHIISKAEADSEFTDAFFVHEVLGHIEYAPFSDKSKITHKPTFTDFDHQVIE